MEPNVPPGIPTINNSLRRAAIAQVSGSTAALTEAARFLVKVPVEKKQLCTKSLE